MLDAVLIYRKTCSHDIRSCHRTVNDLLRRTQRCADDLRLPIITIVLINIDDILDIAPAVFPISFLPSR